MAIPRAPNLEEATVVYFSAEPIVPASTAMTGHTPCTEKITILGREMVMTPVTRTHTDDLSKTCHPPWTSADATRPNRSRLWMMAS